MRAIRQGLREERAPPLVTKENGHDPGEGSQIAAHGHQGIEAPACTGTTIASISGALKGRSANSPGPGRRPQSWVNNHKTPPFFSFRFGAQRAKPKGEKSQTRASTKPRSNAARKGARPHGPTSTEVIPERVRPTPGMRLQLQRSRAPTSTEGRHVGDDRKDPLVASTGPRSVERGKNAMSDIVVDLKRRFNGAALSRARKVRPRFLASAATRCFNGAALSRARKG